MPDKNGQPDNKRIVPVEWQDGGAFDVPLAFRPDEDQRPFVTPPPKRPDTTPPFRQAS
jgi:hypothetical protein